MPCRGDQASTRRHLQFEPNSTPGQVGCIRGRKGSSWPAMANTGGRAPGIADSGLVSREAELERILANLAALETGRGRFSLLVGEPGIGKSRLAREALGRARANGAATFTGRCFE